MDSAYECGQTGGMSSTPAKRLRDAVLGRRHDLDATQLEIWQAGGPSNTTLGKIENAEIDNLTRTTARKLDKGLAWEPGSARRVWEGGEATPLGGQSTLSPKVMGLLEQIDDPELREEFRAALEASTRPGDEHRERGAS